MLEHLEAQLGLVGPKANSRPCFPTWGRLEPWDLAPSSYSWKLLTSRASGSVSILWNVSSVKEDLTFCWGEWLLLVVKITCWGLQSSLPSQACLEPFPILLGNAAQTHLPLTKPCFGQQPCAKGRYCSSWKEEGVGEERKEKQQLLTMQGSSGTTSFPTSLKKWARNSNRQRELSSSASVLIIISVTLEIALETFSSNKIHVLSVSFLVFTSIWSIQLKMSWIFN